MDTPVTAAGDLSVTADNGVKLNATLSNAADSVASALFNASGTAASALLASNMVSSGAEAYIDFTLTPGLIQAGGDLKVMATSASLRITERWMN